MAADALVLKVREAGRVVNVHALIAVGVNAEGHRELLGVQAARRPVMSCPSVSISPGNGHRPETISRTYS